MSSEHARRSSILPITPSASAPRAPPLPPPPLQRARDAAYRWFGNPSRLPSLSEECANERFTYRSFSRHASLSTTQNATASHKTGLEINTIAINESGTHALLGGKEIFKTVRVEDGTCAEDLNLRASIRSRPAHASGQPRQADSIDIADVAWAKGDCGDYVAAATSSGKIILYDLGHAGLPAAQLYEHFRQVHKLTFNPHRGNLLLSGSQDGTVRLWDLRDVRQASMLQSKRKYSGQSDGVRDVKWSPTEGVDFAFGTDSGSVQRWDMRNLKTAKVKIPAHGTTCNTIDWHPDGKHLVSASSDRTVRVWDFSSAGRGQKANWEVKTPHPVLNARWRPSCESNMPHDRGTFLCTQLVTSYDREHPIINIWDFRRPSLPFREMSCYATAPTDLLWHSQDLLWTVGSEGTFLQSDIQHAPKVIAKRPLQAFAISPAGEINFITQRRQYRRVLKRPEASLPSNKNASSLGNSPENTMLSRSWADDSLDDSFLCKIRAKPPSRAVSHSRVNSISRTPPSFDKSKHNPTLKLDDILLNRKSVRPQQAACRGALPLIMDAQTFAYLAWKYKVTFDASASSAEDLLRNIHEVFDHNSKYASKAGQYQEAQTWKVIGFLVNGHLKARLQAHETRMLDSGPMKAAMLSTPPLSLRATKIQSEKGTLPISSPAAMRPISALTEQLAGELLESTSNAPTPLALPVSDAAARLRSAAPALPDPDNESSLLLPPTVAPQKTDTNSAGTRVSVDTRLTASNLVGLQNNEAYKADKRAMVDSWRLKPREPLTLELVDERGVMIPAKLEKHDSNESFRFLGISSDSIGPSLPASHNSGEFGALQMALENPTKPVQRSQEDLLRMQTVQRDDNDEVHQQERHIGANYPGECDFVDRDAPNEEADFIHGGHSVLGKTTPSLFAEPAPPSDNDIPSATAIPLSKHDGVLEAGHSKEHERRKQSNMSRMALFHKADKLCNGVIHEDVFSSRDVDMEEGKPFVLVEMLRQLIVFYTTNEPNAQLLAHIILILGPLLPETHPLAESEIEVIREMYNETFTALGWPDGEVDAVVGSTVDHLLKAGLQPMQLESILSSYHEQLVSHGLQEEAARLRRLAYPTYPAVYEDYIKDNSVGLKCGGCGKPVVNGMDKLKCESCSVKQASCPICWCDISPYQRSPSRKRFGLMASCLVCNHSTHVACARAWSMVNSDGCCATEGCLCDCTLGRRTHSQ